MESALQPPWEALFTVTRGCSPLLLCKAPKKAFCKSLDPSPATSHMAERAWLRGPH